MFKIALLGSKSDFLIEPMYNFFKDKDVDIVFLSNNEHSDFLQKARSLDLQYKYLSNEKNFEYFSSHNFDIVAVCDYNEVITNDVLKTGKFINLHESLLPAFSGDDALYRSFSAGVKVSGITIHYLNNENNYGKIVAQYPVLIGNLTHFDEYKEEMHSVEKMLYPIVIDKLLKDEVFDFSDLINSNKCSNSCRSCGGCH